MPFLMPKNALTFPTEEFLITRPANAVRFYEEKSIRQTAVPSVRYVLLRILSAAAWFPAKVLAQHITRMEERQKTKQIGAT